jgi:hypothetical protein
VNRHVHQGVTAMNGNGLITIPSVHSAKGTIDRIESDIKSKDMTIFAASTMPRVPRRQV